MDHCELQIVLVDRCQQSWISCFIDNEHRFIISKLIFGSLATARIYIQCHGLIFLLPSCVIKLH